jgi:hypothetical protein
VDGNARCEQPKVIPPVCRLPSVTQSRQCVFAVLMFSSFYLALAAACLSGRSWLTIATEAASTDCSRFLDSMLGNLGHQNHAGLGRGVLGGGLIAMALPCLAFRKRWNFRNPISTLVPLCGLRCQKASSLTDAGLTDAGSLPASQRHEGLAATPHAAAAHQGMLLIRAPPAMNDLPPGILRSQFSSEQTNYLGNVPLDGRAQWECQCPCPPAFAFAMRCNGGRIRGKEKGKSKERAIAGGPLATRRPKPCSTIHAPSSVSSPPSKTHVGCFPYLYL